MKKILSGICLSLMLALPAMAQWSSDSFLIARAGGVVATYGNKALFVNGGSWELYDMNTFNSTTGVLSLTRISIKAASVANKAYFGGGQYGPYTDPVYTNNVDVYDFNTGLWKLSKLSNAREVGASAAIGNKVLFAGGRNALSMFNTVDIFDVTTGVKTTARLSKGRTNISVGVNGNKVVFAGGWSYDFNYNRPESNVADIYDAVSGTWTKALLSQKRQSMDVASVGNKIVFFGGLPINGGISNKVDIYDASANTWSVYTLPLARYATTVNVVGSKAYFAGGTGASNRVDVYDASTNIWTSFNMPIGVVAAAGAVINNNIFYAGGYDYTTNVVTNIVQIYNTTSNTWSTDVISLARAGSLVVSFGNTTLFAGGYTKVTYRTIESKMIDIYTSPQLRMSNKPIANKTLFPAELTVYPNPATDVFQVSLPKETALPFVISIFDLQGMLIEKHNMKDYNMVLQLGHLPKGNYILSGFDTHGIRISKIIVKQ